MGSNNNLRVLCCSKIKTMLDVQREVALANIYISLQETYGVDPYFVDRLLQPYFDCDYYQKKKIGNKIMIENLEFKERAQPTRHEAAELILTAKPAGRVE